MAMRKLNIDPELVSYAKLVCERDGIPYEAASDGTLKAKLDDEGEEILIEDAMCEKQRAEVNPEFPVYSYRTVLNEEKFARLQRLNWPDDKEPENAPFHPLHRDEGLFMDVNDFLDEEEASEPIPGFKPGMTIEELFKLAEADNKKKWAEQSKQGDQKT